MKVEPAEDSAFAAFARFDTMVTPAIIQTLFWIGAVLLVFVGLTYAATGGLVVGLAVAILGPLTLRVYCEVLILVFKIHDRITHAVQFAR